MGKLDCVNARIFYHTQKFLNDNWTKIGSCEPTFTRAVSQLYINRSQAEYDMGLPV